MFNPSPSPSLVSATSADSAAPGTEPSPFRTVHWPVSGLLRSHVQALVGVEIDRPGPLPFAIAPHDTMALSVQLARGTEAIGPKGELGFNTRVTGIRNWTGAFTGAGDCVTLFALLTPLGAMQLLDSRPLGEGPKIRASVSAMLDLRPVQGLESTVALAEGLADKLRAFGAWLEARAERQRQQARPALRAARAAMRLREAPLTPMDQVADEQHVSRRQLERDFDRWLGVSPRHLSQVSRVQQMARDVHAGASLVNAAADLGFADQSHMNRVVRQLTGLTPREFVRSQRSPIAAVFRAATGGQTIYL